MPFRYASSNSLQAIDDRRSRLLLLSGFAITFASLILAAGAAVWIALEDALSSGFVSTRSDVAPLDIVKVTLPVALVVGGISAVTVTYLRYRSAQMTRFATESAAATAQLADPSAQCRIEGVHELADLADQTSNSLRRQQCIDALCAYLREPYQPYDTATAALDRAPGERDVRVAIISVIREHLRKEAAVSWSGYDFDFTGAVFDQGSFRGAEFSSGHVSFAHATFTGGMVSFRQARFTGGQVSFEHARFRNGPVAFDHARFAGAHVGFDGARFDGSQISFDYTKFTDGTVTFDLSTLAGGLVSFHQARFDGGMVSFDQARITGGLLSFHRATFAGSLATFDRTRLAGGRVSFEQSTLTEGQISLRGAFLTGSSLCFGRARLAGGRVSFHAATFSGSPVSFDRTRFTGTRVSFRGAHLTGGRVTFGGADFLAGRMSCSQATFDGARFDLSDPHTWIQPPKWATPVPDGLSLPTARIGTSHRHDHDMDVVQPAT